MDVGEAMDLRERNRRADQGDGQSVRGLEEGCPLPRLSQNPLVSVITANYNFGSYLEDTMLSVLQQDYSPIELIVVDGASADNSIEILREYGKDPRVRWVSEPDKGHMDAVNKGLRLARGELIGIQHSTDTYQRGAIRQAVKEFLADPLLAFVGGAVEVIDEQGLTTGETWEFLANRSVISVEEILGFTHFPPIQASFMRRDLALSIGGFYREGCHTNMFLHYMLEASKIGMRCRRVPRIWGNFRVHPSPIRGLDKGSRYYRDRRFACRENAKRYKHSLTPEQIKLLRQTGYYFELRCRISRFHQVFRAIPVFLGYLWFGGQLPPFKRLGIHFMRDVVLVNRFPARFMNRFPRLLRFFKSLRAWFLTKLHADGSMEMQGKQVYKELGVDTRWYLHVRQ